MTDEKCEICMNGGRCYIQDSTSHFCSFDYHNPKEDENGAD